MTQTLVHHTWIDICALDDIPLRGARRIPTPRGPVAIFRTGKDEVYALVDRCPHKGGPLSMGIVHDRCVTCPLHNMKIDLASGAAMGADAHHGCAPSIDVQVKHGRVSIDSRVLDA